MNETDTAEPVQSTIATELAASGCLRRRITWLIGVHAVVAAAPLLAALVPMNTATLPVLWAANALPFGGLMTLAFWAGMGNSGLIWRLAGLLAGCAYGAIWQTIANGLLMTVKWNPVSNYVETFTPIVMVTLLVGGMFAALRWRFQLSEDVPSTPGAEAKHIQFSVIHLLVLMSFVAVLLSLVRGARGGTPSDGGMETLQWWAVGSLVVVTLFANTACAAIAALGRAAVWRNGFLVLLVSVLLGIAIAVAARHEEVGWAVFVGGVLSMFFPATVGVLASLLWLRPCGIRLIRRR